MRVVPLIAAVVSTSLLAYFMLWGGDRSQPYAQQPVAQQPVPQQQLPQPQAPQRTSASAQQQQFAQNAPGQQSQPQDQQLPAGPPLPMPNDDVLLMMINSAVMALNQANATGNYSVLRDLAAPGFQRMNSVERLAQVFTNLRKRNLDLSPVLLFQPKLLRRPEINPNGMLRITGFFPTAPEQVNFDLMFQPVQGRWRLFGIAVNTSRAQPRPAPQAEPTPAPAPEAAKPAAPTTQAAKPPAKKVAPKADTETAKPPAQSNVDIRDRLDSPPAPPPPAEKPKQKSFFNPFGQ